MTAVAMLYGAALSVVVAVLLLVFVARDHRPAVLATAGIVALVMPIWWNLILRWTGATSAFSHDLPFRPFPVSWQDVGSGIFTLAGAAVALSLRPGPSDTPWYLARAALLTALGAFLVDIYLY
jgi:hypothetical protein